VQTGMTRLRYEDAMGELCRKTKDSYIVRRSYVHTLALSNNKLSSFVGHQVSEDSFSKTALIVLVRTSYG
jgi:hypothetical protein